MEIKFDNHLMFNFVENNMHVTMRKSDVEISHMVSASHNSLEELYSKLGMALNKPNDKKLINNLLDVCSIIAGCVHKNTPIIYSNKIHDAINNTLSDAGLILICSCGMNIAFNKNDWSSLVCPRCNKIGQFVREDI